MQHSSAIPLSATNVVSGSEPSCEAMSILFVSATGLTFKTDRYYIEIGDDVSIGHNVTIHGATIHDGALVGMGSVILDHAVVGEGAIVAAGSVVLSKTVIKPGELWGGTPAKFIKMVDPEQSKEINQKIAKNYLMYSKWYEEE